METTAENKAYELKKLTSKDVFPMFQIIKKIGIREFKTCFESDEVKEVISKASNKEAVNLESVGIRIMLDMAIVVIEHLGDAENEIYTFLSGVSGMTRKELENLDLATFTEMIVDVFKKEEFKDFIGVVSKLFK